MNKTNSIYEDNADFYPKVFVPQFIKAIKNQQFTFKEIYPEYNIPESPYLLEDKEDPFVYLKSFLGCGFFAYIGLSLFLLILGMMFFSDHEADYFSVIRPLIYGSTLLIAILSTVTAYRDIKKKTKIACNNYNQELIEYKKKKEEFSKLNGKHSLKYVI